MEKVFPKEFSIWIYYVYELKTIKDNVNLK